MIVRRKINSAKNVKVRRKVNSNISRSKKINESNLVSDIENKLISINEKYGPVVYNELQSRLDKTIETFNKDVEAMFSSFKTFTKNDSKLSKAKESKAIKPKYISDYEKSKK